MTRVFGWAAGPWRSCCDAQKGSLHTGHSQAAQLARMTLLVAELSLSVLLLSAGAAVLRQILSEACFQLKQRSRRVGQQVARPGDEIACMDRVLRHIERMNQGAHLETGQAYTCAPHLRNHCTQAPPRQIDRCWHCILTGSDAPLNHERVDYWTNDATAPICCQLQSPWMQQQMHAQSEDSQPCARVAVHA